MTKYRRYFCFAKFFGLLLLAPYCSLASANDGPPSKLSAGDVQAVFETLLYRGCQQQVKQMLAPFDKEFPQLATDESAQKKICGCSVGVASTGQKMKKIYELPPEQLKDMTTDPQIMSYLKAKVASSLLLCVGYTMDNMIDPKPAK